MLSSSYRVKYQNTDKQDNTEHPVQEQSQIAKRNLHPVPLVLQQKLLSGQEPESRVLHQLELELALGALHGNTSLGLCGFLIENHLGLDPVRE